MKFFDELKRITDTHLAQSLPSSEPRTTEQTIALFEANLKRHSKPQVHCPQCEFLNRMETEPTREELISVVAQHMAEKAASRLPLSEIIKTPLTKLEPLTRKQYLARRMAEKEAKDQS